MRKTLVYLPIFVSKPEDDDQINTANTAQKITLSQFKYDLGITAEENWKCFYSQISAENFAKRINKIISEEHDCVAQNEEECDKLVDAHGSWYKRYSGYFYVAFEVDSTNISNYTKKLDRGLFQTRESEFLSLVGPCKISAEDIVLASISCLRHHPSYITLEQESKLPYLMDFRKGSIKKNLPSGNMIDERKGTLHEDLSPRDTLIYELDKYIKRIESQKNLNEPNNPDFQYGFLFFKNSRALNRQANYILAKRLMSDLKNSDDSIQSIFDDIALKRFSITTTHKIDQQVDYVNRGINSGELNAIINKARKFANSESAPLLGNSG